MTRRKIASRGKRSRSTGRALKPAEWHESDIRRLAAGILVVAVQDILNGYKLVSSGGTTKGVAAKDFADAAAWFRESDPEPMGFETVASILSLSTARLRASILAQAEPDRREWLAGKIGA